MCTTLNTCTRTKGMIVALFIHVCTSYAKCTRAIKGGLVSRDGRFSRALPVSFIVPSPDYRTRDPRLWGAGKKKSPTDRWCRHHPTINMKTG